MILGDLSKSISQHPFLDREDLAVKVNLLVRAAVLEEFLSWLKMRFLGTNIFTFRLLNIYYKSYRKLYY